MLPSFSKLDLAERCVGSASLPRAEVVGDFSERGTEGHRFLENLKHFGREKALSMVPEEYRKGFEAIDPAQLPPMESIASEVGLAYDVKTDKGRVLRLASARDYADVRENEVPGTADVVAMLGADGVYVADYKFGRGKLKEPGENLQLLAAAVAACRAYKRERATVALIFVGEDGDSRYLSADLDAFAVDAAAQRLADLVERVGWARRDVARGKTPRLAITDGCKFCPSLLACPAQAAVIRRLAGDPESVVADIKALLTPETATRAYQRLRAFEEAKKVAWKALYAYAEQNPIPVGDGMVWGPVRGKKDVLDGEVTHQVVAAHHGKDIADEAVTFEATKKGLEDALGVVAISKGIPRAKLMRDTLQAIDALGGLRKQETETFKEHRPEEARAELPPPAPEPAAGGDPPPGETTAVQRADGGDPPSPSQPRRLAVVDVAPGETEEAATARQNQETAP
jgi:hypothetical protein